MLRSLVIPVDNVAMTLGEVIDCVVSPPIDEESS